MISWDVPELFVDGWIFPLFSHLNVCSKITSIFWLWNYNKVKTQAHVLERGNKTPLFIWLYSTCGFFFLCNWLHAWPALNNILEGFHFSKGKLIRQAVAPALLAYSITWLALLRFMWYCGKGQSRHPCLFVGGPWRSHLCFDSDFYWSVFQFIILVEKTLGDFWPTNNKCWHHTASCLKGLPHTNHRLSEK